MSTSTTWDPAKSDIRQGINALIEGALQTAHRSISVRAAVAASRFCSVPPRSRPLGGPHVARTGDAAADTAV